MIATTMTATAFVIVLMGFGGDWAAIWRLLAMVGMAEVSISGKKWQGKSIEKKSLTQHQ